MSLLNLYCKCGNEKSRGAKRCRECYSKGTRRGIGRAFSQSKRGKRIKEKKK